MLEGIESQMMQLYISDKLGHELLGASRTTSIGSTQGQPRQSTPSTNMQHDASDFGNQSNKRTLYSRHASVLGPA